MGAKTGGWGDKSPPIFLPGGMLMLSYPPNFFMIQSQSSVTKFSSFIFLPPEVSDNKPGMDGWGGDVGGHVPSNIFTRSH